MKHLLNTLYILSEDIYLSLDGLCETSDRFGLLHPQREISGPGMRGREWERPAPPDTIPDCRRSWPMLSDQPHHDFWQTV